MHRFWDIAIRPALELVQARSIVEIGAASADHTRLIASWCRERGASATIVDPAPRFEVCEIHDPAAGITVDQRLSLEALAELGPCDVALVDGDHNHHTVLNELRMLTATARAAGRPAPLMICHDVLWPYGRRDLYYDPETVPAEHRQPYRRAGMVPGRSALVDGDGLNGHLCNAEHEGGPANGVLTGIEDAIAGFAEAASLTILPVLYGVAIVVPESRAQASPELAAWVARWTRPEGMGELLELAEGERRRGDAMLQALSTPAATATATAAAVGPAPTAAVRGRSFRPALDREALGHVQGGVLRTSYREVPCLKSPFDLVLYGQLLDRLRPGTVIEIGANAGGSALWFADALSARGLPARVLSVDLECAPLVEDERITFLRGDALDLGAALPDAMLASLPRPWLVVEDSAHTYATTLAALTFFDRQLQAGDVIVVEDGILADLPGPEYLYYEDGPNRAVARFLEDRPAAYEIDGALCDHYGHNVTWSPNGWLRRV